MSVAFEQIKQAEQEAEGIVSAARDQAAAIKKESAEAISAIESAYHADVKAYQTTLLESENAVIAEKLGELDAAWNKEKAEMDSLFAAGKEELVSYLVGKVMQTHGNSGS